MWEPRCIRTEKRRRIGLPLPLSGYPRKGQQKRGIMVVVNSKWVRASFLLYILLHTLSDVTNQAYTVPKYMVMMCSMALGLLLIIANAGTIRLKLQGFFPMLACAAFFILISVAAMLSNGLNLYLWEDMGHMLLPLLFAFILINVDPSPDRDFYFTAIMLSRILYFLYDNLSQLFNIGAYQAISYANSYSPFEHPASQVLTATFIYFYARRKPVRMILSAVFSILSFKRINVVFVLAVLLLGRLARGRKVSVLLINITQIVFIASPLILDFILSPAFTVWFSNTFGQSFNQFTMGRFSQITYVMNYEGSLLGRGAVSHMLKSTGFGIFHLHADLLRIYIETTLAGLVLFVTASFNLVKTHRNVFCYLYMLLMFITYFSSVALHGVLNMICVYFICFVDFDALDEAEKLKEQRRKIPGSQSKLKKIAGSLPN